MIALSQNAVAFVRLAASCVSLLRDDEPFLAGACFGAANARIAGMNPAHLEFERASKLLEAIAQAVGWAVAFDVERAARLEERKAREARRTRRAA